MKTFTTTYVDKTTMSHTEICKLQDWKKTIKTGNYCGGTKLNQIGILMKWGSHDIMLLGLDQNICLFKYSFGGLAFNVNFDILIIFFFFFTPGIPLKWEFTSHSRLNMNRPWVNVMIQFIWKRRYKCRRPRLCVSTLNWVRTRQRQCAKYAIWNWPATTAHQVWKKSAEFYLNVWLVSCLASLTLPCSI